MTADVISIFIGYDPKEGVAYHVLTQSLLSRSSRPLRITPISLRNLGGLMWRERNPLQSTDFSFSRFLTPYLSGYTGWSIFMDSDAICVDDIAKLWDARDDRYAIMCVKHDHRPQEETKFLGAVQTKYEMKNWSSVMMFNNAKCKALTPNYVNTASGLELHRFKWLVSEDLIGALPSGWNHLVGYSEENEGDVKILHYTEGGPYFEEYKDCPHAERWFQEREAMLSVQQRKDVKI